MLKVENIILQTTINNLIDVLKNELNIQKIERFHVIKDGSKNIQTTCPFHKQGQERKPSFGISKETGKCHCFTCGWSGNIFRMVSEIFNINDEGVFGEKWCKRQFNSTTIEERKTPQYNPRLKVIEKPIEYVEENELKKYRYYHPYMYKRGLTNRIIDKFDIGFDNETQCITFPVHNTNDNCVFIARRSINTKYFNYPENVEKPVYALSQCVKNKAQKIYVVESILNCLTLWKFGIPAVSLIGLGSTTQIETLKRCNIRHFVLALDPDYRGRKAQEKLKKALNNKILSELIYTNEEEDINDLQEKILELKEVIL